MLCSYFFSLPPDYYLNLDSSFSYNFGCSLNFQYSRKETKKTNKKKIMIHRGIKIAVLN